jgi:glutathione S-transferase
VLQVWLALEQKQISYDSYDCVLGCTTFRHAAAVTLMQPPLNLRIACFEFKLLQVWLALEEKQIPYDCVLIELYNKPEWYKELVPTSLVPAVVSDSCHIRYTLAAAVGNDM